MRIAIAGCGQLARMLALAGWEMGHDFVFIADPTENIDCVSGLGEVVLRDEALSGDSLYAALGKPDVVTVEKEHVSVPMLESLSDHCLVAPSPEEYGFANIAAERKPCCSLWALPPPLSGWFRTGRP